MDLIEYGLDDRTLSSFEALGLESVGIGRIVSSDNLRMVTAEGEKDGRPSGRLRSLLEGIPVVGDWVVYKHLEDADIIVKVLPRRTHLSRKNPGKQVQEQLVAANIDLVIVVMGLDGDYNLRRLERYLVMIAASGAQGTILLNKCDLVEDPELYLEEVRKVAGNTPVHLISALEGKGIEDVPQPKGKTLCLVGSSGSGKSTLINRLLGEERQATTEVGSHKAKGRHTTTSRELFLLPNGAMIIDNPGIREIQLLADPSALDEAFPEIAQLAMGCRFKDCQHLSEPGCPVLAALASGDLPRDRYDSYQKLQKEIAHNIIRSDKSSEAAERDRWKAIHKNIKHYYNFKKKGR